MSDTRKPVFLDTPEGRRMALAELFIRPLLPVWGKAPEDARCLQCGAGGLERSRVPIGGPFSGKVRCLACGHEESVMSQIGKTLVTVEPLPEAPTNRNARRAQGK